MIEQIRSIRMELKYSFISKQWNLEVLGNARIHIRKAGIAQNVSSAIPECASCWHSEGRRIKPFIDTLM
jgi:hypothetical protein